MPKISLPCSVSGPLLVLPVFSATAILLSARTFISKHSGPQKVGGGGGDAQAPTTLHFWGNPNLRKRVFFSLVGAV